jgi:hypothetical protein
LTERGRRKANQTEPAKTQEPSRKVRTKPGKPAGPDARVQPTGAAEALPPVVQSDAAEKREHRADTPAVVYRDGVAYLEGCDTPIWRLEMARRAGSEPEALLAASPGLTARGLDIAFAYARRHRAQFNSLIQQHSGALVPLDDEDEEDAALFEAELDALLKTDAEVFRRLAQ